MGDALAAQTYTAFLSHYANLKKLTGLDKDGLVAAAALFATKVLRRAAAPAVPATLVGTLGLKGAAGLLIEGEPFAMTNESPWQLSHSDGAYAGYASASAWSPRANTNIAVAMVSVEAIESGNDVVVHTEAGDLKAQVAELPII